MRWSKILSRHENGVCVLDETEKVVVFGGGSFGTAMAVSLARQKKDLSVMMLLRDPYVCKDINSSHINSRYLQVGSTLRPLQPCHSPCSMRLALPMQEITRTLLFKLVGWLIA